MNHGMLPISSERRGEIETYFDRTAVGRLGAPDLRRAGQGRIRATVRAGRDRMRHAAVLVARQDLQGRRLLDAGCGTGAQSPSMAGAARRAGDGHRPLAHAGEPGRERLALQPDAALLARRIEFASSATCSTRAGRVRPRGGDGFADPLRRRRRLPLLHGWQWPLRTRGSLLFTFAPRTPALAVMHATGRLFPRGDRAPCHRAGGAAGPAAAPDRSPTRCPRLARRPHSSASPAASTPRRPARLATGLHERHPGFAPPAPPGAAVATPPGLPAVRRRGHARSLPLPRLLRLSLFQVSVGMAYALLLNGTLNRVMIVELGMAAWLVALMVALPLCGAPVPRPHRLPLRHPPLGAGLAPGAVHLVRHACCSSAASPSCRLRCWCSPAPAGEWPAWP